MKNDNEYLWQLYKSDPDEERRAELLKQLKLDRLGDLTWRQQADVFLEAPVEIILEYLPKVSWEAQVKIYKDYLPVGAREKAWSLLDWQAENKIKYRPRSMKVLA